MGYGRLLAGHFPNDGVLEHHIKGPDGRVTDTFALDDNS